MTNTADDTEGWQDAHSDAVGHATPPPMFGSSCGGCTPSGHKRGSDRVCEKF